MANEKPAADTDVWWGGLRWVEGVLMQAERFETVFYELDRAIQDSHMRAQCNESSAQATAWRRHYDRHHRKFDSERPIRVPTWALAMQVRTDLDLLIVAVRNVLRAQVRLPIDLQTQMSGQEVLELLRNLSEHWDEIGGRSAEKLEENYPDVSVDTVKCTNKEIWIANVPLSRIRAWVNRVRESLIAALESVGVDVPDDMGSMIGGDDALSWPADRHRYRLWMIPLVEMRDWPTDEIPTEVGALISERFARLRARDVTD